MWGLISTFDPRRFAAVQSARLSWLARNDSQSWATECGAMPLTPMAAVHCCLALRPICLPRGEDGATGRQMQRSASPRRRRAEEPTAPAAVTAVACRLQNTPWGLDARYRRTARLAGMHPAKCWPLRHSLGLRRRAGRTKRGFPLPTADWRGLCIAACRRSGASPCRATPIRISAAAGCC